MTIGLHTIGEAPIGAEAEADGGIALIASVEIDTAPPIELYARVELNLLEALSLSATIDLNLGHIDLYAPVEIATSEDVTLTAPIEATPVDGALVNRTAGNWALRVLIDGVDYTSRLTGAVTIDQSVNASCLAQFTIIPVAGPVFPGTYISKRVQIDWIDKDSDGTTNFEVVRYIGVISDPIYLPATGELNISCTTDLQGVLDASTRDHIDSLTPDALWSPNVFDEGANGWEYAQDRMRTIPASMWHSPGGVVVTDWAAKATPDFTFTDAELFVAGPYQPSNRRTLLNVVEIQYDFRFQRKRQRTLGCNWSTNQTWCEYLQKGYTLCQKAMVEQAANSGDWLVQGDINFTPVPSSGSFKCFSGTTYNYLNWLNPPGSYTDRTFCIGASWRASRRWLQTATERYNVRIECPQSIAGNGEMANRETFTLQCEEDTTDWLTRSVFSTALADNPNAEGVGGNVIADGYSLGDIAEDATNDPDTGRAASDLARSVMIAAATTDVLGSHRANSVPVVVSFQPNLNLTHTVRVDSAHITAKGKVDAIRDILNVDTGEAISQLTLAISRHEGSGLVTPSPLDPVDPPDKPVETDIPNYLNMVTRIGGTKTVEPYDETWTGFTTNWIWDPNDNNPFSTDPNNPQTILYPQQFRVEYPEISGGALDAVELASDQTILVDIPDDELTLTQ